MKIKAKITEPENNTGRIETIELPVSGGDVAGTLIKLTPRAMDIGVYLLGIEPKELTSLCGRAVSFYDLNYLAERLAGLSEYQIEKYLALSEIRPSHTIEQAVDKTFDTCYYTLVKDGDSPADIGRNYLLENGCPLGRNDYDNDDLSDIGKRHIENRTGVQTSHGTLYGVCRYYGPPSDVTADGDSYVKSVVDFVLKHNDKEEVLRLPSDEVGMERTLRRLGAASYDDCVIECLQCNDLPYNWLKEILPDITAGDIPDINAFVTLCAERGYGEEQYRDLITAMKYAGRNDIEAAAILAINTDSFYTMPDVTDVKTLGEKIIKQECGILPDLCDYVDCERFGRDIMVAEKGRFIENYGYIGTIGDLTLNELIENGGPPDEPAEKY